MQDKKTINGKLMAAVFVIVCVFVVSVYSSIPNPGHSASQVGSGAFYGISSDVWSFPGSVGIGVVSPESPLQVSSGVSSYGFLHLVNTVPGGEAALSFRSSDQSLEDGWTVGKGVGLTGTGFSFYGNSATRLTISDNGSVGIGTTTPSYNLHVVGDIYASGNITCGGSNCGGVGGNVSGGYWNLSGSSLFPNSTSYNVGIGTAAPRTKLHIEGVGRTALRVSAPSTSSGAVGDVGLSLVHGDTPLNNGTTNQIISWSQSFRTDTFGAGQAGSLVVYRDTAFTEQGSTGSNWAIALKPNLDTVINGNVGIGTTTPSYNLHVVGDIYASGNITCGGSNCGGVGGNVSGGYWNLSGSSLYPGSTSYNVGIGTTSPGARLHVVAPLNESSYPGGSQTFSATGSGATGTIRTWTVPYTGTYTIEVWGAQGGQGTYYTQYIPGKGARMRGDFTLAAGTVLRILVGQQGVSYQYDGGGGGGSFVTYNSNTPLIVAGGGGGSSTGGSGADAVTVTSGTAGPQGGTGGSGGGGGISAGGAGAGAGITGSGGSGSIGTGGTSFVNGGSGGTGYNANGGFGGGGGAYGFGYGGGGGGGYSGGGASASTAYGGGGGGSYNAGDSQSNSAGVRSGDGQVVISWSGGTITTMGTSAVFDGNVGIGTSSPGYVLDVAGAAHASSFPTSSDRRFKTNISELTNVLDRLERIRGVTFDWNDNYKKTGRATNGTQIGVIAQEVEMQFPELVTSFNAGNNITDARSVDYGRLSAVLLEGIKEQQKEIDDLKALVCVDHPGAAACRGVSGI
jgi:hypothetical protein